MRTKKITVRARFNAYCGIPDHVLDDEISPRGNVYDNIAKAVGCHPDDITGYDIIPPEK